MKRVLLVDIDFVLSGYISKKLHSAGVMVQKTSGAEQVLSYMERVKPDCIIVDIQQTGKEFFLCLKINGLVLT